MLYSLLQLAQAVPAPMPETLPAWLQGIIALVLLVTGVGGKHAWTAYRKPSSQSHPTRGEFQALSTKVDKMDGTLEGVDKNVGRLIEHLLK